MHTGTAANKRDAPQATDGSPSEMSIFHREQTMTALKNNSSIKNKGQRTKEQRPKEKKNR